MVKYNFLEAVNLVVKYPELSFKCCASTYPLIGEHMVFEQHTCYGKRLQWQENEIPIFIDEQNVNNLEFELDILNKVNGLEVEIITEPLKGLKGYLYVFNSEIKVCANLNSSHSIQYRCTSEDFKIIA